MKTSASAPRLVHFALLICVPIAACHSKQRFLTDHPQAFTGVRMQDVQFESAALGRMMTYRVFLPAKSSGAERLPVVFLLHGNYGSYRDWSNDSNVGKYALNGLVLVMPQGDTSYYVDAEEAPNEKYGEYLTKDLIEDVQARFPVRSDRAGRALVGVSMGGYAAIEYALARPDLYSFAGAISPAVDVPSRGSSLRRFGQTWRFRRIFGPAGSAERRARDPFIQVREVKPETVPYLYVTAGEQEPLFGPIKRFVSLLEQRGFAFEFHTKPGAHDWSEWDAQIPGCFSSLLEHLRVDKGLHSSQP